MAVEHACHGPVGYINPAIVVLTRLQAAVASAPQEGQVGFKDRLKHEQAGKERLKKEQADQVSLIHDVFGNPFHPVCVGRAWARWRHNSTPALAEVIDLAKSIYEEDLPAYRLSVLADALENAGCDIPELVAHCRGRGRHVRGCWAVDSLLGMS
jgi:hypothetical protein